MNIIEREGKARVTIGTNRNLPGDDGLFVERGILTERVRVAIKNSGAWADYVFAPEYKLSPLADVQRFIKANHHLPGVPSADEVVKEGVDAAQMDAKLLEKIEELTLHLIAQEKKIAALETIINAAQMGVK